MSIISIEKLPADIIRSILSGLKHKYIVNLCKCSKILYKYLKDPELWKIKLKEEMDEDDFRCKTSVRGPGQKT